jgi:hypothetical protein
MVSSGVIRAAQLGSIIRIDLRALETRDAAWIQAAKLKLPDGYAEKASRRS